MNVAIRVLAILLSIELPVAVILSAWRLNSTSHSPPPVEIYTDAITSEELRMLPDRFLFDSPEKWRVLGETYLKLGFLHQAAACLGRAAESDPRSMDLAVIHGYCLDRLGQSESAEIELHRAAQQGDGLIQETAWYFLGRIFLQREQSAKAVEAFRRAGDGHLPSVFQRAKLLVRDSQYADASPLLRRLIDEMPDDVRIWHLKTQFDQATGVLDSDASAAGDRTLALLWIHNLPPSLFKVNEDIGMAREFNQALQQQQAGNLFGAAQRMLKLTGDETRWQNSNPWLPQTVAAVQLDAGLPATARRLLNQQIVKEGFPTAHAWNLLGYVEFLEHHSAEAQQCWQRARFMNKTVLDYEKKLSLPTDQHAVP